MYIVEILQSVVICVLAIQVLILTKRSHNVKKKLQELEGKDGR